MNENKIYKEYKNKMKISPVIQQGDSTNAVVYSFDLETSKFSYDLKKNGEPFSLATASDVSFVLRFGGSNPEEYPTAVLIGDVEDRLNGKVSFVMPKRYLGFNGRVLGEVNIQFTNGQSLTAGHFSFVMKPSYIDEGVEIAQQVYVERFEDLINIVENQTADLDGLTTDVQNKTDEIKDLIVQNDVLKKAEAGSFEEFREQDDTIISKMKNEFEDRGVNVKWFGILPNNEDITDKVITLLKNQKKIFFPAGKFIVNGTIILSDNESIHLSAGTELVKTKDAHNDDPVIWIKGKNSNLSGVGLRLSNIKTEKFSPLGVILIGYNGLNQKDAQLTVHNNINNLGIEGAKKGGLSSQTPDSAICIWNEQINDTPVYFNNLDNIYLSNAHIGIDFIGYANANMVNRIYLNEIGNEKILNGAGIRFKQSEEKYPLDNMISNVFHHKSNNAITILFDGKARENILTNIVCEQGGPDAKSVKNTSDDTASNTIICIDNVAGGSDTTDFFKNNNIFFTRNNAMIKKIYSESVTYTEQVATVEKGSGYNISKLINMTDLEENITYELISIETVNRKPGKYTIEIDLNISSNSNVPYVFGTSKFRFEVDGYSQPANINLVDWQSTKECLVEPIVQNQKIIFGVKIMNNQTNTNNNIVLAKVTVMSVDKKKITIPLKNTILDDAKYIKKGRHQVNISGTSSSRPNIATVGDIYFDTTINRPIFWNGKKWVDSSGSDI